MNKKVKGSAIIIVIISGIVFSIYTSSTYAESEHFSIMQKKYENNIKEYYEKDIENIDDIYTEIYNINKINEKNIIK